MRPRQFRVQSADCSKNDESQPASIRGCTRLNARRKSLENSLVGLEVAAFIFNQQILSGGKDAVISDEDLFLELAFALVVII